MNHLDTSIKEGMQTLIQKIEFSEYIVGQNIGLERLNAMKSFYKRQIEFLNKKLKTKPVKGETNER